MNPEGGKRVSLGGNKSSFENEKSTKNESKKATEVDLRVGSRMES